MLILQIVVLALIQGITEFLPISSSGHLLLVPALTGWKDQGVLTDVMVHMGSFLAVVVYFWKDCINLTMGFIDMLRGRANAWGRLALLIVVGTIPAVVVGIILDKMGIRFTGHPDLSPLLLPEDATYHPLRKDFVA